MTESDNSKVTMEDFTKFVKYLVELGNTHYVDDHYAILAVNTDNPVGIKVGKKLLPLQIWHENMVVGDYVTLNLFVEKLAYCPEKHWFFTTKSFMIDFIVRKCIKRIIEIGIQSNKEDIPYEVMEYVSPYLDTIDEKMINELKGLKTLDLLELFYHKQSTTIQLQTKIYEEDFVNTHKPKPRVKFVKFLQQVLEKFFKTTELEEIYKYKSQFVGMQETDAYITMIHKICSVIEKPVKALLDIDFDMKTFDKYIANLTDFHKLTRWMGCTSSKAVETTKEEIPPWRTTPLPSGAIDGNSRIISTTESSLPNQFRNRSSSLPSSYMSVQPENITYASSRTNRITYAKPDNPHSGGYNYQQPVSRIVREQPF